MYYYGMSKEDIYNSSRRFIYSLYQQYVNRACENLGVSLDENVSGEYTNSNVQLSDEDYPKEWVSFSQIERQKYIDESEISDDDFLKQFDDMKQKARQPK